MDDAETTAELEHWHGVGHAAAVLPVTVIKASAEWQSDPGHGFIAVTNKANDAGFPKKCALYTAHYFNYVL